MLILQAFLRQPAAIIKPKLIHISTDYVYDGSTPDPLKEEDAVAPLNVYGWSKLREKNSFSIAALRHLLSELPGYIQFMETTL